MEEGEPVSIGRVNRVCSSANVGRFDRVCSSACTPTWETGACRQTSEMKKVAHGLLHRGHVATLFITRYLMLIKLVITGPGIEVDDLERVTRA